MGQQVNTRCEWGTKLKQSSFNDKYLRLDPKPGDLTTTRDNKSSNGLSL